MYTDEFARQRDAAAFCFVVALMGLVVLLLATPWLLAVCASVLLVVGYFVVEATPRIQREERRRGDRTGPAAQDADPPAMGRGDPTREATLRDRYDRRAFATGSYRLRRLHREQARRSCPSSTRGRRRATVGSRSPARHPEYQARRDANRVADPDRGAALRSERARRTTFVTRCLKFAAERLCCSHTEACRVRDHDRSVSPHNVRSAPHVTSTHLSVPAMFLNGTPNSGDQRASTVPMDCSALSWPYPGKPWRTTIAAPRRSAAPGHVNPDFSHPTTTPGGRFWRPPGSVCGDRCCCCCC